MYQMFTQNNTYIATHTKFSVAFSVLPPLPHLKTFSALVGGLTKINYPIALTKQALIFAKYSLTFKKYALGYAKYALSLTKYPLAHNKSVFGYSKSPFSVTKNPFILSKTTFWVTKNLFNVSNYAIGVTNSLFGWKKCTRESNEKRLALETSRNLITN